MGEREKERRKKRIMCVELSVCAKLSVCVCACVSAASHVMSAAKEGGMCVTIRPAIRQCVCGRTIILSC